MKTEADLTQELKASLLKDAPRGSLLLKHADRFTFAVPDLSCSHCGITRWLEIKYVRVSYKELTKERVFWLQMEIMQRLYSQGIGWYVVFFGAPIIKYVDVLSPEQLKEKVQTDTETDEFIDRRNDKDFTGVKNLLFDLEKPNGLHRNGA